jgi:hypothetical protein
MELDIGEAREMNENQLNRECHWITEKIDTTGIAWVDLALFYQLLV